MPDLLAAFARVKRTSTGATAQCPAHEDATNSLSIGQGDDGRWLLHCHAGCALDAILAAAHLTTAALFSTNGHGRTLVTSYDYRDEQGALLYQVCRFAPKEFRQRAADGSWSVKGIRRVLYRLPELQGKKTVFIPEGEKDVDRLWALDLPATTNAGGAGKWRAEYAALLQAAGCQHVVILPDHDPAGAAHGRDVARSSLDAGLDVKLIPLPGLPPKGDVSDYLATHSRDDLIALVQAAPLYRGDDRVGALGGPVRPAVTLADVDQVFCRWLGEKYDLDALHAVLAAAAAERLSGDPLWLLLVSGSGAAKTETVQSLAGAGAIVTSTIASEGALLSGSPKRETAKDATGGLLRRLGSRGVLVVKDMTSILAMNRDTRAAVLAALREIHDQKWERNIGTDGGRSLTWTGRIVVIGAVTTAWDRAHDVIASMGDRFVIVRMDSSDTAGRASAGKHALLNTGREDEMRRELAAIVGSLLGQVDSRFLITLTNDETARLEGAANVVALARTGVDCDYRGDVVDAHAPEMPTRFTKQLFQVMRGAVALGVARHRALQLAIRCARDSMPPLRLAILDDLATWSASVTRDIRKRLAKPRATVDRQLQSLHMLGVLTCVEEDALHRGQPVTVWRYDLADGISPEALDPNSVPEMSPHTQRDQKERCSLTAPTDISGTEFPPGRLNHERV